MYPFVPGCSTQKYFPYDEEENAEQYKKVQKQRALERKVRASKRECMMLKDGDPEAFQKASVKLKHNTQQLKTYCSSNDLTYMNERTTVMGYGRSEAGKATAAYNRALKQEQKKLRFDKEELLKEKPITQSVKQKIDESAVLEKAEKDLSVLPQKHRDIIDKTLKQVVITDNISGYSNKEKALAISVNMEEGDMVHEAGHIIFHALNIQKDDRYQKILQKGIENITNYDIIINTDYQETFYQLNTNSDKFLNEYQKRVYINFETHDYSAEFDYSTLREYFSEGYRAYFKESENLKKKDPDLYNYIGRLVNDN